MCDATFDIVETMNKKQFRGFSFRLTLDGKNTVQAKK